VCARHFLFYICCAQTKGRILVSDRAHLLFDVHKEVDGAREAELAVRASRAQRDTRSARACAHTRAHARARAARIAPP
jgi:adenylosuccinate synthase